MSVDALEILTQDTVVIGKYIFMVTTARTGTREVSRPQPAVAAEQSSNAQPVWETWPRFNRQGRSSDRSKVPCASGWETDLPVDLNTIEEVQTLPPTTDSLIGSQPSADTASASENAKDEQAPQPTSLLVAGLAPKRLRKHEVRTQRGNSRSQASRSVRRRPSISNSVADAVASFMRNRTTAWNAKVQRVARNGVAKLRFQRRRKPDVAGVPTSHREGTEEGAQRPQRSASEEAINDSNAEADGRMIGVEFYDLTVGVTVSEQNAETIEVGEPMDLDSEDDAGDVAEEDSDGDPMELDEDDSQLAIMLTRKRFAPKKTLQRQRGKVLHGRISREKAAIPLRQTVSSAVAVSAPSNQQQAVPVSASVVASADISLQQPVARCPIPTNSPADLREARLGKKPEARGAKDEAAAPSPLRRTSPSDGAVTEDEHKSDTTEPTTTPTSTPPSSTPSSLPASPLSKADPAPIRARSPKQAPKTSAPQHRKRWWGNSVASKRGCPAAGPKPTKRSPSRTQASGRVQQRRANDDEELIPLNDLAGQGPSVGEIQQQVLGAQMDNCPDSDTDLDWSSSDEEGPEECGGKEGGERKREGKGKEGK